MKPMTATFAVLLIAAGAAMAQSAEPSARFSVRFTAGTALLYLDEPWVGALGASVRIPLCGRLGLEPEIAIAGTVYRRWTFIPNLVVDLGDRRKRAVTYLIGGIGYFHETYTPLHFGTGGSTWNGGLGVRVRVGKRVYIAPEFRIGHVARATVSIGYSF